MEQGWNEVKLQAINNIFGSLETQSQKKKTWLYCKHLSLYKNAKATNIYIYIYEYHSNNCFSAEHQDRKSLKAGKTESQNQGRKTQKKTPFFLQNP